MRRQFNGFRSLFILCALGLSSSAFSAIVDLDFTLSFGTTPATGAAPWLEAEIDDSFGDTDTVRLTITTLGSLAEADVTELYFNLNPVLDPTLLAFTRVTPTNADLEAITVLSQADTYRADGDGYFDIFLDLPTGDNAGRLNANETLIFDITYTGDLGAVGNALTASSFFFLSAPGPGNSPGPFLAAAHIQSTGTDLEGSDWVAAVPLPAAIWLLLSSLGVFGFVARRRRTAAG
jgi:hypothetical protein